MHLTVLTLFPDLIEQVINESITGRARAAGLFSLKTIQIRDFAVNRYGKVDDACYGGGTGMLMMAEPVYHAWLAARAETPDLPVRTIHLSPRGKLFSQDMARELAASERPLVLLCGHYEGIDQRVLDEIVDDELSIGDYVLTGGELAACVVIDALLRLVPGVLPAEEAYTRESHMDGLLEYPQYTRPAVWHGQKVPDVLMSGHQAKIERWQSSQAALETLRRRPDLARKRPLDEAEWADVLALRREELGGLKRP
ncbi:MAG: tRNA (guanosine(37)-N1)-methyltransferase TrmD [Clostridiales bacterium]|nr:tRNA (guanosine(37)-N1)-methyltransferase TrmD [Clostridiales bacterium]